MNDHLRAVQSLLLDALEIEDAQERAAFLARSCGADLSLRQEVEGLITAQASAGQFLPDQPSTGAAVAALAGAAEEFGVGSLPIPSALVEQAGDRVGRYKLLQKIGEGGCGLVYMAEQETPVRRRVALKIIKLGMDTRNVVARFEAERQALALMDHPNIAKVLDAGATETGRPYFVMELVRGVKITRYCDEQRSSMRQRLELFIQVCQAVQHAHQKGIIHRDLKPSNILVTERDGQPVSKVIDFGIAKATGDLRLTDKTLFTAFEQFIGTPAYMSPEQARLGELDIDTRSDIYSLGVLLYELLTGKTPFETQALLAAGLDEMRRTIREKQPARPSTRLTTMAAAELTATAGCRGVEAAKLVHAVRGDLDWVIMKCLEKDRTRRYESANGLATDVRRHLYNEPVVARPPSRLYEFQKTVRRHKVGFAATAAVIVVLAAGVVTSTWQAVRATDAERREAVQREKAEAGERKAVEARALAQAGELSARQRAYTADMNVVQQAWDDGNLRRAQSILQKYVPKPGSPDLRGFEWRYLWKHCQDESRFSFTNFSGEVRMALSPDGRFIAAGSGHSIKLLDYTTRCELDTLQLPDGSSNMTSLAFLPTDTNVLATVADQTLHFWNLTGKRATGTLTLSNRAVAVAFSRDGKLLAAVGGYGGTIELWRVEDLSFVWSRKAHLVHGLAFAPDNNSLVTDGGSHDEALVWDLASGTASSFPIEHRGEISAFAFSPNERLLATGSPDATVILWDLAQRKLVARLIGQSSGGVATLAFSPDGHWLVTGNTDGTVRLWDVAARQQKTIYRGHQLEVPDVAISPDGSSIISSSWDGTVKVWDIEARSPKEILTTCTRWVRTSLFSPDSQQLVTRTLGVGGLTVWDVATRSLVTNLTLPFPDASGPGGISPDGRTLALVAGRRIALWDAATFSPRGMWTNDFDPCSLSFAPDSRTLAVSGLQGASPSILDGNTNRLTFWDLTTQRKINKLAGAAPFAIIVKFSHDGRKVAIGYLQGEVRVWDLETGRKLAEFADQRHRIWAVAFSPDDAWLVAGGFDGSVSFYDLHTQQRFRSIQASTWTAGLCFTPDGKTLASAEGDGTIKLWNMATREIALVLKGHIGQVSMDLSFSSDGKYLATCGADGTVRLWLAATLEEIGKASKGR